MSKPSSGHFSNTTGAKNSYNNIMSNRSASDIITSYTRGLDTSEHPTKYKQLSSKKLKELNAKEKARTLTKDEYKRRSFHLRLTRRRNDAINSFWKHEKALILHNLPTTRNCSSSQKADIINGKRPKYKGKTMHSHHTFSVAKYPHLANKRALIYPATPNEHINGWHGGNTRTSKPGRPIKNIVDF